MLDRSGFHSHQFGPEILLSTLLIELYDALKEAGASEEKARAAAESLVIGSDRLERIEEQTGRLPKMQDPVRTSSSSTRSSRSSRPRSIRSSG